MKKRLAIYTLILKSLAADCAKKARDSLLGRIAGTTNGESDIKRESIRLLLLGRYRASRVEKRTRVRISTAGAVAIAVVVLFSAVASFQVFSVSVNGQVVGYVHDREDYASLMSSAREKLSKENGNSEIIIKEEEIKLKPVLKLGVETVAPAVPADAENTQNAVSPVEEPQTDADTAPSANALSKDALPADTTGTDTAGSGTTGTDALPTDTAGTGTAGTDTTGTASTDTAVTGTDTTGTDAANAGTEVDSALEDALIDNLLRKAAVKATVYNIEINGQPMATLATMKEASEVLQNIAAAYAVDLKDAKAGFIDDVRIIGKTLDLNAVHTESVESATEFLLTGINDTRSYTAKEKDTLKEVMAGLNITEEELRFAYPEYDFHFVEAGDVFEHTLNTPYLRYEMSGIEDVKVPVPYETIEKRTNSLYLGERKTEIAGVDGLRHVQRNVTRVNGILVNSEEIFSEMLTEPSPATVLTGTLLVPGDAGISGETGGGPLGRPLASWYFSRGLGGAHMGDDMLAPQGTPIMSAEHGVVTFTGVYGGYGNLIKVDHGNGLETYYAHCDTINVEVGQIVERGQQIGTVGITGRATAYHLHFEVRVDGAAQEPLDWIS